MARRKSETDDVLIVTADGSHIPGQIIDRHENGTVNVVITHRGAEMLITSSPHDEAGKMPDSWHFAPPASAGEPIIDQPAAE